VSKLFVDLPSVIDRQNHNDNFTFDNCVYNSIVADSNSPVVKLTLQLD
jgi:hypothetical protein